MTPRARQLLAELRALTAKFDRAGYLAPSEEESRFLLDTRELLAAVVRAGEFVSGTMANRKGHARPYGSGNR
jgi:hypothetical protein